MKVDNLVPKPLQKELFKLHRQKFVTDASGCYALTNFPGDILYLGLASNLRRRFEQHLEAPEKVKPTPLGVAYYFYWLEAVDLEKLERTWINAHTLVEGKMPHLNKVSSPLRL